MTNTDDSRELGVEFGDLAADLDSLEYPASNEDVLARVGDREIGLPDGSTTVTAALEPLGAATYESPQEVRQAVLDMVGDDAVGREGYSDRGTVTDATAVDESL
ncbi:DUF5789 family protein [Halobacteriales archaeon Cl-PHB]